MPSTSSARGGVEKRLSLAIIKSDGLTLLPCSRTLIASSDSSARFLAIPCQGRDTYAPGAVYVNPAGAPLANLASRAIIQPEYTLGRAV